MRRGYSFRFRLRYGPLVLAAAGCAAGIALGNWQTRRGAEKVALAEALDASLRNPPVAIAAAPVRADELVNRHVEARGAFAAARTVYLDNRNRGGRPGYEVVTPLMLSPSVAVLVQRGWVERGARERVSVPAGAQHIDGIALARLPRAFSAGGGERGPIRQNLDIAGYAKETGLALQPVVIQQRNDNGDGLARDWPRPDFGVDTHRAYALQWYSLAGLSAVLGIVFSFRRVAQG
jgi:cytochrome oxidase assembly protein ShyY1